MVLYFGNRPLRKLYEEVQSLDELIKCMEVQLSEFRRMNEAGVEVQANSCLGDDITLWAAGPTTVREFGFEEDDRWNLGINGQPVPATNLGSPTYVALLRRRRSSHLAAQQAIKDRMMGATTPAAAPQGAPSRSSPGFAPAGLVSKEETFKITSYFLPA